MEYPIGMYIFFGLINYSSYLLAALLLPAAALLFSFGQGSAASSSAAEAHSPYPQQQAAAAFPSTVPAVARHEAASKPAGSSSRWCLIGASIPGNILYAFCMYRLPNTIANFTSAFINHIEEGKTLKQFINTEVSVFSL